MYNVCMENLKIEEEICFCEDDFDSFGLKNFVIFKKFNDIAIKHANTVGFGFDKVIKDNHLWITTRMKYQVLSEPKLNQKLKLISYPSRKYAVEFDRDYIIVDENENVILNGVNKWCLIHKDFRKIVMMKNDLVPILPDVKPVFEEYFFKTDTFEPEFLADYSYTILHDDIDLNGHANNTTYAKMLDIFLKNKKRKLKFCQINFLKETFAGDRIDIFTKQKSDSIDFLGKVCEGEKSFSAHVEFE